MALFDDIADERRLFADLLDTLTTEEAATPSLCGAWTVHDIGAHLVMPLCTPTSHVVVAIIRSSGSGDLVSGPGEALLLAMTGRDVALAGLTGDGVGVLSGRS